MLVDKIIGGIILLALTMGCLWACDKEEKSSAGVRGELPAAYTQALAGVIP